MIKRIYPVTCHTKNVGKNSTFVAIKGFSIDGNQFIKKAIELGASKIVSEEKKSKFKTIFNKIKSNKSLNTIKYVQVKNSRKALAELSSKALKTKNIKTKIIGITGTKGKTTTTYIIEHILKKTGFKTAVLGTITNKILNVKIESFNTTPESDFLHMFLSECDKQKIDFLIMEVSSHALSLHRTHGIKFDAIGFTNLAHEHLDFYKNIENYFSAKLKIFDQLNKNSPAIVNIDNIWGKKAIKLIKNKNIDTIQLNKKTFHIIEKYIPEHMPGEFNLYNFSMAYFICKNIGIDEKMILKSIQSFQGVPGRLQRHILKNNAKAFVDYAHNPSSMEEVLKTLRPLTKDLITVFGCGGNRDKEKRPIMGQIAIKYSDKVIITDDNPRFESSESIINEILSGINKTEFKKIEIIAKRDLAIFKSVQLSSSNSIIAILGKGHENYHLIKDKKLYFDDFEEINKY